MLCRFQSNTSTICSFFAAVKKRALSVSIDFTVGWVYCCTQELERHYCCDLLPVASVSPLPLVFSRTAVHIDRPATAPNRTNANALRSNFNRFFLELGRSHACLPYPWFGLVSSTTVLTLWRVLDDVIPMCMILSNALFPTELPRLLRARLFFYIFVG